MQFSYPKAKLNSNRAWGLQQHGRCLFENILVPEGAEAAKMYMLHAVMHAGLQGCCNVLEAAAGDSNLSVRIAAGWGTAHISDSLAARQGVFQQTEALQVLTAGDLDSAARTAG